MSVLIFDVETTGLPTKWNPSVSETTCWPYIVQFSWIIYSVEKNEIVSQKDWVIKLKDGMKIPEESTKIHGITNEAMEYGHPIEHALEEFLNDYNNASVIVAHNLKFDKSMVMVECLRNKINIQIKKREFCTMLYGEALCGLTRVNKYGKTVSKYPKLIELHNKLFDYEPSNLHNSLYDVAVCLRCYIKLRYNKDLLEMNERLNTFPCF